MFRFLRGALLVTVSLLAWAATASAECAWVFWKQTVNIGVTAAPPGQLLIWEAQAAYENNKKACEDALLVEQRRLQEAG